MVARASINAVCKHWDRVMKKRFRRFVLNARHSSKMLSGRTLLVVEDEPLGDAINAYDLTHGIQLIAGDMAKHSTITRPTVEYIDGRVVLPPSRLDAKGFNASKVHLVSDDTVMMLSSYYDGGIEWLSINGTHASITITAERIHALYGANTRQLRVEEFESRALGVATMHVSDIEFLIVDARDGKGGRLTVLRDGILSVVHASSELLLMRKYVDTNEVWHIYSISGTPVATLDAHSHQFMFDLPDGSLTFMDNSYSKFIRVSPTGEIHTRATIPSSRKSMYILTRDTNVFDVAASPNRRYFACVQPDFNRPFDHHHVRHHMCTPDCVSGCDGTDNNDPRTFCVYRTSDFQLVAKFDTFEHPKVCGLSVDDHGRVFALYENTEASHVFNVYAFPCVRR